MSKLFLAIPPQNFEVVRDRIASILAVELAAQKVLQSTERVLEKFQVFTERVTPFDKGEDTIISVLVTSNQFENHDVKTMYGDVSYSIDCYSSSKSNEDENGSAVSRAKVTRMMGLIRAILSAPVYVTLDFTSPFIVNRSVKSIQISDDENNQDSFSVSMGRLNFSVKMLEDTEAIDPKDLNSYQTIVKIDDTEEGFVYEALPT